MVEFLKRLRRLWLMSARRDDPNSLQRLIEQGVVTIGEHSYGDPRVIVWTSPDGSHLSGRVRIGRYCSMAGGTTIMTGGEHRTDYVSTFPFRNRWDLPGRDRDGQTYSRGDVVIGNDVWIGENALIRSGVTIGDGAVVGAGSVVTRDVEPYAIVAGNPARVIRHRHPPDVIAALLEIGWWDWPESKIRENVALLSGPVDEFVARFL